MRTTAKIGGLPAAAWVGRVIIHSRNGKGGGVCAVLRSVDGRRAVIRPMNHGHTETVDASAVKPMWSKNPDLKAMADATKKSLTKPEQQKA